MMKKLIFFLFVTSTLLSQDKYIHAGKIYESNSGNYQLNKTIIISDNFISSIEDGFIEPKNKNIEVYDLKTKVLLPGLIDFHVHMESESGGKERYINRFQDSKEDVAFKSTVVAKKTLLAGFTTVRDVGGSGVNIALRNAINQGLVDGPRIFTSGKTIATTGGHGDPTNGYRPDLVDDPGPKDGVVNSISDARKAVRYRYKNGADLIKITATGGVMSMAKNGQNPQFTIEEIKAICETAKDYDMTVAAHAHGDEGIQRAIKGGVLTIEHGTLLSDESMKLMKEYGTYYVPTITAGKEVAANAKIPGYYDELVVPKALAIGPKIQSTTERAYKAGVNIAFGSDAGVFPHGNNAKEFRFMNEAGIPVIECLQAATIVNSKILSMDSKIGQIKNGFFADIIATKSNPENDIRTLENVIFVMKNGEIYKN